MKLEGAAPKSTILTQPLRSCLQLMTHCLVISGLLPLAIKPVYDTVGKSDHRYENIVR